jgi:hypothetical protein
VAIVTVPRHTVPLTSKVLRQDNSTPAPRAAVSHTDLHVPVSHTSTEHRNAPSTPPSGPDSGLPHRSPLAMPPRLHVSARASEDHDREKARKAPPGPVQRGSNAKHSKGRRARPAAVSGGNWSTSGKRRNCVVYRWSHGGPRSARNRIGGAKFPTITTTRTPWRCDETQPRQVGRERPGRHQRRKTADSLHPLHPAVQSAHCFGDTEALTHQERKGLPST